MQYLKVGDKVKKGEKILTIYSESEHKLKYAWDIINGNSVLVVK